MPSLAALATGIHVRLYRLTGGRMFNTLRGAPLLLLTTTGRKTGQPRTSPLIYRADGESLVLVASAGGASHHPAWYLNLLSQPRVTMEIGRDRQRMVAETASPAEHARLWPLMTAIWPLYNSYQQRTDRPIPIVILRPERR